MNIAKSIKVGMALKAKRACDIKKQVGKTSVTVSSWINGHSEPRLSDVRLLAELFEINVSTFIEWGE